MIGILVLVALAVVIPTSKTLAQTPPPTAFSDVILVFSTDACNVSSEKGSNVYLKNLNVNAQVRATVMVENPLFKPLKEYSIQVFAGATHNLIGCTENPDGTKINYTIEGGIYSTVIN